MMQLGVSRTSLCAGINLMTHATTTEMYNVAGTQLQAPLQQLLPQWSPGVHMTYHPHAEF